MPFRLSPTPARFWWFAALCAAIPDIDYVWTTQGLAHDSMWAHRGITHSVPAAIVLGDLAAWFGFDGSYWKGFRTRLWVALSLAAVTHGLLDSLTTYALGVAFFAPFSAERFYFTWRPLAGIPPDWAHSRLARVTYQAGMEFVFIWIPAFALLLVALKARRIGRRG